MYVIWPLLEGLGTLTCNGEYACNSVNFPDNPTSSEALVIDCDSNGECGGAMLYCPMDAECTINCDAASSCSGSEIHCPDNAPCIVNCNHEDSCVSVCY